MKAHRTLEDMLDDAIAKDKRVTNDTYNANVRVRDLPRSVDRALDLHATMKRKLKWEIIRDALEEYVKNHEHELARIYEAR